MRITEAVVVTEVEMRTARLKKADFNVIRTQKFRIANEIAVP
jgi:hypothetical protein